MPGRESQSAACESSCDPPCRGAHTGTVRSARPRGLRERRGEARGGSLPPPRGVAEGKRPRPEGRHRPALGACHPGGEQILFPQEPCGGPPHPPGGEERVPERDIDAGMMQLNLYWQKGRVRDSSLFLSPGARSTPPRRSSVRPRPRQTIRSCRPGATTASRRASPAPTGGRCSG